MSKRGWHKFWHGFRKAASWVGRAATGNGRFKSGAPKQ